VVDEIAMHLPYEMAKHSEKLFQVAASSTLKIKSQEPCKF